MAQRLDGAGLVGHLISGLHQGLLQHALAQATDQVTDEASAIEAQGHAPLLVPGGAQNFKVTYPDDFALAEAVLARRMQLKEPS